MQVTLALRRQRQEDQKFKVVYGCIVNSIEDKLELGEILSGEKK